MGHTAHIVGDITLHRHTWSLKETRALKSVNLVTGGTDEGKQQTRCAK